MRERRGGKRRGGQTAVALPFSECASGSRGLHGTGWLPNLALTRSKSASYPLYQQPLLSELSGGALETFAHPPRSRCSSPGACANGKRHRNGYIPTLILKKALSGP